MIKTINIKSIGRVGEDFVEMSYSVNKQDGIVCIETIYVAPSERRKGLAKKLILELLNKHEEKVVRVDCTKTSKKFWIKLGFKFNGMSSLMFVSSILKHERNNANTLLTPIVGEKQKLTTPSVSTSLSYVDIELAIAKHYGIRQHIIVPNCFINFGTNTDHECDLIVIKKSGYAIEVEIKMSKADLKADFKKKHGHIDERLQHLYYAMPKELYEKCKDLIPEYAGVFSVTKHKDIFFASIEKIAPKKQCRKLSTEEQLKIARLGVMRIWNLKQKFNK